MPPPPPRPLTLLPHNPAWPHLFRTLANNLTPALTPIPHTIQHIGSTSVEGLYAKPIIDLTIILDNEHDLPRIPARLAALGYTHLGDLNIKGREAFRHKHDNPPHNLYAGHRDCPAIRNHIAFRDALRADPILVKRYSTLKRRLAAAHPDDIPTYTARKTEFIINTLTLAAAFTKEELNDITRANTEPNSEPDTAPDTTTKP